jgi:hypothetical protein
MSSSDEEQGPSWDILDESVTLTLVPSDGGDVLVRFTDAEDERIWTKSFERGFWDSRTTKGEIGNNLAREVPHTKNEVKSALEEVWTDLTESTDEYERDLRNPSVEELIENTQRVEVHGGPETEYDVFVTAQPFGAYQDPTQADAGTETRKLTFSNAEWVRSDGDTQTPPVVEKYSNKFYRTLDITWQQWREDIRPAWEEMQEIITDDHQTTAERISQSCVRLLRKRLDAHAEKSRIINDTWNGWWDDSGSETTIWVDNPTLTEILEDHNRDGDYLGALSRALQQEGFTSDGREQAYIDGNPISLYPFPAEVLGIEEIDVIGLESDDDGDGEGETSGGDGGDGGDGGGNDGGDSGDGPEDDAPSPTEATADRTAEIVAGTVEQMDDDGTGVDEDALVAEVSEDRDMPPDDAVEAVEQGVVSGQLYRPDNDDTIALRPGGGEPAGRDELPLDEPGVPNP